MKEVNHNYMDSCLQDKILAGRVKSWNSKNVRLYITKLIEMGLIARENPNSNDRNQKYMTTEVGKLYIEENDNR